jgi:hypothetical protein
MRLKFDKRCTAHVDNFVKTAVHEKDIDCCMRCGTSLVESIDTLTAIETMTSEMLNMLG